MSCLFIAALMILWILSAGERELVAALGFACAGLWMVVTRPATGLPRSVVILAIVCSALAMLSFLPTGWGLAVEWRKALVEAGVEVGTRITPQPAITASTVVSHLVIGLVVLRLLAGGNPGQTKPRLVLVLTLGHRLLWHPVPPGEGSSDSGRKLHATDGCSALRFFPQSQPFRDPARDGTGPGPRPRDARDENWPFGLCRRGGGCSALVLGGLIIFANVSRAGILLSVVGVLVLLVLNWRRSRRGAGIKFLALFALGAGVIFYAADQGVKERLVEQGERAMEAGEAGEEILPGACWRDVGMSSGIPEG